MVVFRFFDLILDVPSPILNKCNRFIVAQSLIHSISKFVTRIRRSKGELVVFI